MRILVPTDENTLTLGLLEAYRSLGHEVVAGAPNLRLRTAGYDVVHVQWPEEYVGWFVPPSGADVAEIERDLAWHAARGKVIFTVHNLLPHYGADEGRFHDLYSAFYRHADVISHFSEASRRLVLQRFPAARGKAHIVHHPPNYDVTLALQESRGSRRADFGIKDDEFVILMFGRLRSWNEVWLVMMAYDRANIPNKRLLVAGSLALPTGAWLRRLQGWRWRAWLRRRNAAVEPQFVPENRISRLLDSADVTIVPRLGGLNSAIILLGMSFGRMIVAPDCGGYPEHLAGTRNLIYRTGDAASLAAKLEQASRLDTAQIGKENAEIARTWTWRDICAACLQAVQQAPRAGS